LQRKSSRSEFFLVAMCAAVSATSGCAASGASGSTQSNGIRAPSHMNVSEEIITSVQDVDGGSFHICNYSNNDHIAFAKRVGDNWQVVLDGAPSPVFNELLTRDRVGFSSLYPGFSEGCKKFVYGGLIDGAWHVATHRLYESGGFEAKAVDEMSMAGPFDSKPVSKLRDGDRPGFYSSLEDFDTGRRPSGQPTVVVEGNEWIVKSGGMEIGRYPVDKERSKLLTHWVCPLVMTDCDKEPDRPIVRSLASAPKTDDLGFTVQYGRTLYYVIDGIEYGPYQRFEYLVGDYSADITGIRMIEFSPSGQHFAFQARRGRSTILNIDGADTLQLETYRYRRKGLLVKSIVNFPIRFDNDNSLYTFAIKNDKLVRITVEISENQ